MAMTALGVGVGEDGHSPETALTKSPWVCFRGMPESAVLHLISSDAVFFRAVFLSKARMSNRYRQVGSWTTAALPLETQRRAATIRAEMTLSPPPSPPPPVMVTGKGTAFLSLH